MRELQKKPRGKMRRHSLKPPSTIKAMPLSFPFFQMCANITEIPKAKKKSPPKQKRNATMVVFGGGYRTILGALVLGVNRSVSPLPTCM